MLAGEKVDRIPVFPLLMGFSAKRAGFTYRQFASDGSVMADAQLKAVADFGIDVITACSDAFRVAADLGGEILYQDENPPCIRAPIIACPDDLRKLGKVDISKTGSRCADRANGVREMVRAVGDTHLVLGWVDYPFAEACSCCGVQNFMVLILDKPEFAHAILEFLTEIVIDFALLQLEQGSPMIGCGDAAASLVSVSMFAEFVLPYEKRVVDAIHGANGLVKTHICGNTFSIMDKILQNKSDLFNVDHMVDLKQAVQTYCGAGRAIKGNLNSVTDMLQTSPEHTYEKARECIATAGKNKYFLSAGCEIPPGTPAENLHAFCDAAKQIQTSIYTNSRR